MRETQDTWHKADKNMQRSLKKTFPTSTSRLEHSILIRPIHLHKRRQHNRCLSLLLFNQHLTESHHRSSETLKHPDTLHFCWICLNWIHHIVTRPIKNNKPQSLTSWNWASLNRRVHRGHKERWRRGKWQLDSKFMRKEWRGEESCWGKPWVLASAYKVFAKGSRGHKPTSC